MNKQKFFNRELSWLSFNYRVLQEAMNPNVPLIERIKFLAIYSSNLDEFYRVRVASLRTLLDLKKKKMAELKFDPVKLLQDIHRTVHKQQEKFGKIFHEEIIPGLKENNIHLVNENKVPPEYYEFINEYFHSNIFPFVQPVLTEQNNITLFLKNRSIYLAVKIQKPGKKRERFVLIEIPTEKCGRFILLPGKNDSTSSQDPGSQVSSAPGLQPRYIMFIDDVLRLCLKQFFPGYNVLESWSVKLTRDAELYIDDEFSGDLRGKVKKSLSKRTTGAPSRFLYDYRMPKKFLNHLENVLELKKDDVFPGGRYHNFFDFFSFPDPGDPELVNEPMPPLPCRELDESESVFDAINKNDILLHYPYQSFDYVVSFLTQAAIDPLVKSIKITLYRTAKNSKIIKALIDAVKKGKSVTAFVEVKARFDEELNFQHAEELEKAGVNVIYSFPGLKVHSKICIIRREEERGSKIYVYLATGNFNEKTANVYSDFGFFTVDETITGEIKKVFNILCKKSEVWMPSKSNVTNRDFQWSDEMPNPDFAANDLLVAPFNLREGFEKLVKNEIISARHGKKAYIILKLNSLEDKKMINKLYKASRAGVKILIIVRGICCLIPGIPGLSSNIKAISIVDRFLEHSRVYIFCNNGDEKIFLSSADWMTRNLNRRTELCFPINNIRLKKELKTLVKIQLRDNVKARIINRSQSNPYKKSSSNIKIRSQYETYKYFKEHKRIIPKLISNANIKA